MRRRRALGTWIAAAVVAVLAAAAGLRAFAADEPLRVRVVDARTGNAVRSSDVLVSLEGDRVPEAQRAPWSLALTTDAEGRASVPGGAAAGAVRVQTGDGAGRTALGGAADEVVVFLAPQGFTVVQVIDERGVPRPGVPVAAKPANAPAEVDAVTEGAFGTAVLACAPVYANPSKVTVRVDLPFRTPVTADFDPAPPDGPPLVRLRLPKVVAIEVGVAGVDGFALARIRDPDRWMSDDGVSSWWMVRVTDGRCVFDVVPPEAQVMVEVRARDPLRPLARALLTTPAAGSPPTKLSLRMSARRAAFVGRLVGADGAPLARRRVQITVRTEPPLAWDAWSQHPRTMPTTGADGRFRLDCDRDAAEVAGATVVVEEFVARPETNGGGDLARLGVVTAPAPAADGTIDLGDFTVGATPALVSGTVVDEEGAPVRAAWIMVQRRSGDRWVWVRDVHAESGESGAFAITKPAGAGELRLIASLGGRFLDAAVPFERGAAGVVLRLARAASLDASFRPPQGTVVADLVLVVEGPAARQDTNASDTEPRRSFYAADAKADPQTFVCSDLRPGAGSVSLRWRGAVVWGPVDVTFEAGRTARVADAVDVAKLLRPVVLTVRRADGKPAAGARVWTRPAAVRFGWRSAETDAAGRATVLAAAGPLDVLARDGDLGAGSALGVLEGGDVVVRDRTPRTVHVRVTPPAREPGTAPDATPLGFSVALAWAGPPGTVFDVETFRSGAAGEGTWTPAGTDGTAAFTILQPGVYAVLGQVAARGLHGAFTRSIHDAERTLVTVPEDGTAAIDVSYVPDADELEAARDEASDL